MRHHVPPATHFSELNLLTGQESRISLSHNIYEHASTRDALLLSHELGRASVPYTDSLLIEVDLSHAHWGVAAVGLAASKPFGEGITTRTLLCFGTCAAGKTACELIFASVANYYIHALLQNPKADMPALREMPEAPPWGSFFLYPKAAQQKEHIRSGLIDQMRTAMAATLSHCRTLLAANPDPYPGPVDDPGGQYT